MLVQHAIEGRFLCVNVDGRCLVLGKAVRVRAGEIHEVETRAEGDSLASESSQANRAKSGAWLMAQTASGWMVRGLFG